MPKKNWPMGKIRVECVIKWRKEPQEYPWFESGGRGLELFDWRKTANVSCKSYSQETQNFGNGWSHSKNRLKDWCTFTKNHKHWVQKFNSDHNRSQTKYNNQVWQDFSTGKRRNHRIWLTSKASSKRRQLFGKACKESEWWVSRVNGRTSQIKMI